MRHISKEVEMKESNNIRSDRTNAVKYPTASDRKRRAAKYNYTVMDESTVKAAEGFPERLAELRSIEGVSGREMSLSLGQAAGYINSIENGKSLPSLSMFFEICEYLEVSPKEFFSYTGPECLADYDSLLSKEDRELLLVLAKKLSMQKEDRGK